MRKRWSSAFVVAIGVALLLAACTPPAPAPTPYVPAPAPLPPQCNPITVSTCGLPFPSDQWTRPDPSSPTGIRLAVPNDLVPPALTAQFHGMTLAGVYDHSDGFSAAGPIVFELDHAADPAQLDPHGGSAVQVFDRDTGTVVPVDVELPNEAALRGRPGTIVFVWPRSRFPWGHHLVAAVTTALQPAPGGAPFTASKPLQSLVAQGRDPRLTFLAAHGVPSSSVVSMTEFTVRTEQDANGPFDRDVALVRTQPHPVRNLTVTTGGILPYVGAVVNGQVQVTSFRDANGAIDWSSNGTPQWVDFLLMIPQQAPRTGAPVAIYGHGLSVLKETMVLVAVANAQHGIATIGIDQPNHATRIAQDGGFVFDLFHPADFTKLAAIVPQSSIDMASLETAVKTSLASLDVAPYNAADPLHADGVPDLDPHHLFYMGTSLGGVIDTAYVAETPSLDGALLQVTGVGFLHTATGSAFWDFGFNHTGEGVRGVIPDGATAGEAALLINTAQHYIDPGDAINVADRIHANHTPFIDIYGIDDGTVPNASTEALLELAQVPVSTPVARAVPQLGTVDGIPPDGTVAVQAPTTGFDWLKAIPPFATLTDLLTHVAGIVDPRETQIENQWIGDRMTALGL